MTNRLHLEWLTDDHDCETCGYSEASGMRASLDGHVILELIPRAHCFGGDNWSEREAFELLLEKLGYPVAIEETAAGETNE